MLKIKRKFTKFQNKNLQNSSKNWTKKWCDKVKNNDQNSNKNYKFSWHNKIIIIREEVYNSYTYKYKSNQNQIVHCIYCEVKNDFDKMEIDHIESKIKYCEKAYDLSNLILCCSACNRRKRERELKIFEIYKKDDYEFQNYFLVELDGTVKPKPDLNDEIKEKIEEFIDLIIKKYSDNRKVEIDKFFIISKSFKDWEYLKFYISNSDFPDYLLSVANLKNINL